MECSVIYERVRNCKVLQTAVDQIIDGITNLFDVYSNIVLVNLFKYFYKYLFMYLFNFSYLIFLEKIKSYNDPETCLTNFKDIENVYKDKYSPAVISSDIKTRKR